MYKNITLEVSLKPFKKTDDVFIREVCTNIYRQWFPLLKNRGEISIMIWVADGSEILDYAGNENDIFEWACFIGNANKPLADKNDDTAMSPHTKKRYYMKNPPVMTYKILKNIVAAFKEEGKRLFPDSIITVGETFDLGPEFAESDFKYKRHTEICGGEEYVGKFVDTTALLNEDKRRYAAFPNGIPDKTPIGYFLGMQANEFLADMGFDFIWLSNGMGFSLNPWKKEGKVFDGENFHIERLSEVKASVNNFWELFRKGCPDFKVRTRGTNYSAGIDYASDGVPLYDIYSSKLNIMPPPNSPWAALNDNFGLELMGHMTRICDIPDDEIMFRYYIHDPWWINSPWYDRYDSSPHDIYLPMSVSRIDENAEMQSANVLSLLTIDNSFGDMPDSCVYEPLPHILKAEKNIADEPAPFVWVYPMREFTRSTDAEQLREMYMGDTYIQEAINSGFPLNCVVTSDNFLKHSEKLYKKSIIVSPLPCNDEMKQRLLLMASHGIGIIIYGTKAGCHEYDGIENVISVDITLASNMMLQAAEKFRYFILHERADNNAKVPAMTISRHDNAMFFSVYNPNTATKTKLKFPLGAPILMYGETKLEDGYSTYHFSRAEHRECRVFVKQNEGVISIKEATAGCFKYRRRILIKGLQDATICYFSENYSKNCIAAGYVQPNYSQYPKLDESWELAEDTQYGTYIKAEHITGDCCLFMPTKIDWQS